MVNQNLHLRRALSAFFSFIIFSSFLPHYLNRLHLINLKVVFLSFLTFTMVYPITYLFSHHFYHHLQNQRNLKYFNYFNRLIFYSLILTLVNQQRNFLNQSL